MPLVPRNLLLGPVAFLHAFLAPQALVNIGQHSPVCEAHLSCPHLTPSYILIKEELKVSKVSPPHTYIYPIPIKDIVRYIVNLTHCGVEKYGWICEKQNLPNSLYLANITNYSVV